MLLEVVERDHLKRDGVGRLEHDIGRTAGIESFFPTGCAQTPAVARLQAGETVLGHRRAEIVALYLAESKERLGHHHAYGMKTVILLPGVAAAITEKAGQRLG